MLAQTHLDFEDLEKHNFGSTISGTTFRYIVTALNDRKYVRVAAQAPQSSYHALEMPYTFNGVGRSNNYLESFNVAYTTFDKGNQVRVFTPIIPNSQLVIAANSRESKSWQIDLFINPMEYLVIVVLASLAVLVLTGIIIIIMHCQEKKEDKSTSVKLDYM